MNERVRFIGSLSHYLVAATTFKTLINGYTRLFIWRKINQSFLPPRVYFNTAPPSTFIKLAFTFIQASPLLEKLKISK